jgi:hypothetical protein
VKSLVGRPAMRDGRLRVLLVRCPVRRLVRGSFPRLEGGPVRGLVRGSLCRLAGGPVC